MRAVLGGLALAALLGVILNAFAGNWGAAAGGAFAFWVFCGWFIAVGVANANIDNIRQSRENEEDES